jgi:hypothetical protein
MSVSEELMIEAGLFLKQDWKEGRDVQSNAFFNTPGMPWLYSGARVPTRTPDYCVFDEARIERM